MPQATYSKSDVGFFSAQHIRKHILFIPISSYVNLNLLVKVVFACFLQVQLLFYSVNKK